MLPRLLTAAVVAALLVLAACGSDGEPAATTSTSSDTGATEDPGGDESEDDTSPETTDDDTSGTGEAPTTAPAVTEPVDVAGDQAAADAAMAALTAYLEEQGFVADPPSDDAEDDMDEAFDFESEDCADLEGAFPDDAEGLPGETAEGESATFELEQGGEFSSAQASMGLTAQAGDLDGIFELLTDERMPDCLREMYGADAESGDRSFEIADIEVEASEVDGLGDDNVRFVITYEFTQEGEEPFPVIGERVMARADRIAAMAMVIGFGADELAVSATEMAGMLLDTAADELG